MSSATRSAGSSALLLVSFLTCTGCCCCWGIRGFLSARAELELDCESGDELSRWCGDTLFAFALALASYDECRRGRADWGACWDWAR